MTVFLLLDDITVTHSGFTVVEEISVAFKGEKSSVTGNEGGILMKLEEDKHSILQDTIKCCIQKFSSKGAYS